MVKNNKETCVESFKEMYGRSPSKEELKAFIECIQAKREGKQQDL